MSEAWSNLLAALVGAIVGGAASLAGTVLVNKMHMATNARMRLYDDLLPRLERALDAVTKTGGGEEAELVQGIPKGYEGAREQLVEVLAAVRRASAIAGREERAAAHRLMDLWRSADLFKVVPIFFDTAMWGRHGSPESFEDWWPDCLYIFRKLRNEIRALSDYLGAKLG